MKVVNLFGGPGSGKSTLAAELFVHLKKQQKETEYVPEYAKDLVWEERKNILEDQLYVLAKQNRKLSRLRNKGLEYAVTDSPLLLGVVYDKGNLVHLPQLTLEVFRGYDNVNFFVCRRECIPYKTCGRLQNLEEAKRIDEKVLKLLKDTDTKFSYVHGLEDILKLL